MQALQTLVKSQKFILLEKVRYNRRYLYASRRFGKQVRTAYLSPVERVNQLTEEQVLLKLAKVIADAEKKTKK